MSTEHANDAERDDERDENEVVEASGDAPKPVKPRTYKRARAVADPSRELSIFGALPADATHFGIKKLNARDKFESQFAPSADGEAEVREWPLAQLSIGFVRQHWGGGQYRVEWVGPTDNGGRGFICNGRPFTVRAPEQAVAPQPAAAPTPFQQAVDFMNMTDRRVGEQLDGIAKIAQIIAGVRPAQPTGPDASTLELMFQRHAHLTRDAVQAVVAPLQEEVSNLRARIAEFEEDEEEEEDDRAAPASAAPVFRPGEPLTDSVKAWFMNWAASHPEQAMGLAKEALSVVGKIAGAVQQPPPAQRIRVVTKPAPPAALPEQPHEASPATVPEKTNGAPVSANQAWSSVASAPSPAPAASEA